MARTTVSRDRKHSVTLQAESVLCPLVDMLAVLDMLAILDMMHMLDMLNMLDMPNMLAVPSAWLFADP